MTLIKNGLCINSPQVEPAITNALDAYERALQQNQQLAYIFARVLIAFQRCLIQFIMCAHFMIFNTMFNFNLVPESCVSSLAETMLLRQVLRAQNYRNFKALHDVTPKVISAIWGIIKDTAPNNSNSVHILLNLLFLKGHNNMMLFDLWWRWTKTFSWTYLANCGLYFTFFASNLYDIIIFYFIFIEFQLS